MTEMPEPNFPNFATFTPVNMPSFDPYLQPTVDIVCTCIRSNGPLPIGDITGAISFVYAALRATQGPQPALPKLQGTLVPAVPVNKSVGKDWIVCLEDGKKFKSLKRHLSAHYGLTPAEYRTKWGLPPDYPMVAPSYAAVRSKLAKANGLGRK